MVSSHSSSSDGSGTVVTVEINQASKELKEQLAILAGGKNALEKEEGKLKDLEPMVQRRVAQDAVWQPTVKAIKDGKENLEKILKQVRESLSSWGELNKESKEEDLSKATAACKVLVVQIGYYLKGAKDLAQKTKAVM